MRIKTYGTVTISQKDFKREVSCNGFEFDNEDDPEASCRKAANLAVAWAIGVLQSELLCNIDRPGGGNISVMATESDIDLIERLRAALEQLLDDMGDSGHCVCEDAKQMAKDALTPDRRTTPWS